MSCGAALRVSIECHSDEPAKGARCGTQNDTIFIDPNHSVFDHGRQKIQFFDASSGAAKWPQVADEVCSIKVRRRRSSSDKACPRTVAN
jgi:hypothetical protein